MKIKTFALLLASTALVGLTSPAFSEEKKEEKKTEAAKPKKDYTILDVNGQKIKHSEVEALWQSHFPSGAAPEFDTFDARIKENLIRGVISERLIYDEALSKGVDKRKDVADRLAAIRKQLILQAYMDEKTKDVVTDAKIKAAYDEKVKTEAGKEEVHARHILLKTEEEAKDVLKQVRDGGNFEVIAKEKSTDKASGASGGDLGYFTQDKMVPEFGAAAFALKKGEVSEPVKSDFGWHVIKLEDRRKVTLPPLDKMKDSIRQELSDNAVTAYVETLLAKAKIKYFDDGGKEIPFSAKMAPPAPAGSAKP